MSILPSISMIVPVSHTEQQLCQLLDSLLAQTLRELEILCINDAADAATAALLNAYAARDSRIRLLHHATRRGHAAAYNTGISSARAPYIMFCRAQAWYAPTLCAQLLAALQGNDGVDMAICGVQVHGIRRRRRLRKFARLYHRMQTGLVPGSPALAQSDDSDLCNKLFRRSIIAALGLRFAENLVHHGDFHFFHRYIPHVRSAYVEPAALCHRSPGSPAAACEPTPAAAVELLHAACRLWGHFCGRASGMAGLWHTHGERLWMRCLHRFAACDKRGALRRQAAEPLRRFLTEQGYMRAGALTALPAPLAEGLDLLYCAAGARQRRGLATETRSYSEYRLSLCGLPLRRVQYGFDAITTTSSPVGRPRVQHGISAAAFHPFELDNSALLATLRSLGEFTFIPDQGNLGDALLATATLRFFDAHHLPYRMLCDAPEPADVVVYGGGGIWIPDYEQEWLRFLPIFRQAKRVVILPGSYRHCDRLLEVADERFTLFCREMDSYAYLRSSGCKATIIPDHDMALRLTADFLAEPREKEPKQFRSNEIPRSFAHLPQCDVGYLLRSDSEGADIPYVPGAVDLSACAGFSALATRAELAFYARFMLCAVDYFGTIVTDRLHVGIAAALMGKQTYLLDNSYRKLSAVYTHSLQSCPHIHMVEQLPRSLPPAPPSPNAALFAELRRHHLRTRECALSRIAGILAPSGS